MNCALYGIFCGILDVDEWIRLSIRTCKDCGYEGEGGYAPEYFLKAFIVPF